MQTPEHPKDAFLIWRFDADSVVRYCNDAFSPLNLAADFDFWRILPALFDSLSDQILEHLRQQHLHSHCSRQISAIDPSPGLLNCFR